MAIHLLMSSSQNFSQVQVMPWLCLISQGDCVSFFNCIMQEVTLDLCYYLFQIKSETIT